MINETAETVQNLSLASEYPKLMKCVQETSEVVSEIQVEGKRESGHPAGHKRSV